MEGSPDMSGEAFGSGFEGDGFEAGDGDAAGGSSAPGMGQSKSSRRRRRKRKKAGSATSPSSEAGGSDGVAAETSGPVAVPIVMEGESLALAASAAPPPRRSGQGSAPPASFNNGNGQGGPQGQGQGQNQGQGQGKRWKKKFRDRDRERRPGQGSGGGGEFRSEASSNGFHNANGGGERQFNTERSYDRPFRREGGGRPDNFGNLITHQGRKTKSQGGGKERGFVGPMDHSYREITASEFGEAPPSTIQVRGRRNGHRFSGDNQPIDHNAPRPVPIPDDAQTHIYLFVEDLFITAKVQETARKLGVKVAFIKNEKDAIAELTSGEAVNKPALIVFDLNNANAKPLTLIPKLKTKLKRSASIIGFLSTIQGDLKAKAVEAGCDTVMPKAAFSQNLPNLLRRYGVEEAEEINYNY